MTSPPGGGMRACPKRASSGPASKNEARMRSDSPRSSTASALMFAAHSATSWSDSQATRTPSDSSSDSIAPTSLILRDVADHDLVLGQDRGGEDGQGTVLVAGRDDRAGQRDASVDDELLHERVPSGGGSRAGGLG